jgi:phosphoribosyl-AMP cyclohydrolase
LAARIEEEIVVPSVRGVQRQGWTFRGFLFIGLMVDRDGPRVLEYNVRFGDPEAQAILTVVSGDLGVLFRGLAAGRLAEAIRESNYGVRDGVSCAVVAAPGGYPGPYTTGDEITIEPVPPSSELAGSTELFFSGVSSVEGALGAPREQPGRRMKTSGGRVLTAVAFGRSLDEARRRAYARLQLVGFSGMRVRSDIGGPAILSTVVEESDVLMPQFRKRGGLVPVVVQDAGSGDVLMVAYANAGAVRTTLETGYATFWSTSRSEEWTKGATSGNRLRIMEVRIDCDQDALLYRVELEGRGVCHTRSAAGGPRRRCFYRRVEPDGSLAAEE